MNDRPLPTPNCPIACRIMDHVPLAHVWSVDRTLEFYALLGFQCDSLFSADDGVTNFAAISSGQARLMFAKASEPVIASQQAVLFYMYSEDVQSLRDYLLATGLVNAGPPPSEWDASIEPPHDSDNPCLFDIRRPFYMPDGELRIHDPDGYCILVGQLECRIVPK
jgi:hypothetical protein